MFNIQAIKTAPLTTIEMMADMLPRLIKTEEQRLNWAKAEIKKTDSAYMAKLTESEDGFLHIVKKDEHGTKYDFSGYCFNTCRFLKEEISRYKNLLENMDHSTEIVLCTDVAHNLIDSDLEVTILEHKAALKAIKERYKELVK